MCCSRRLLPCALLVALVPIVAGCPDPPSVVGTWEVSVWNGPCLGDPAYTVTASFNEGGSGTFGTGVLQWNQTGRNVSFLAGTIPPSVVVPYAGTLTRRNRMEGTYANGNSCWEARRLSDLP